MKKRFNPKFITAKRGSHFNDNDAKLWAKEALRIAKKHGAPRGFAKAEWIVEEAKSPKSPLHRFFTWDVKAAAEQWWIQQARVFLRSIVVRETEDAEPVRMFFNMSVENNDANEEGEEEQRTRYYVETGEVLHNAGMRKQLLAEAEREFESFRQKYHVLKELSALFSVAEDIFGAVSEK